MPLSPTADLLVYICRFCAMHARWHSGPEKKCLFEPTNYEKLTAWNLETLYQLYVGPRDPNMNWWATNEIVLVDASIDPLETKSNLTIYYHVAALPQSVQTTNTVRQRGRYIDIYVTENEIHECLSIHEPS